MSGDSIFDAHIHVWSKNREKYPLAHGFKDRDLWIPSYEAEDHITMSESLAIQYINFVQITWYGTDHSYIIDLISENPTHFVGTGIIPAVTDIDLGSTTNTMTALANKGILAFRVRGKSSRPKYLSGDTDWLNHYGYHEMFETGSNSNLAISFLMDPEDIPEVNRMCTLYPKTPVIIDHLSRIGTDGCFREKDIDSLCSLSKHPNVMVKLGPFNHLGSKSSPFLDVIPMLKRVVNAFGSSRCMWESDSPALRPGNYHVDPKSDLRACVDLIREHSNFLPSTDKENILFNTAYNFFFKR